MAKCQANNRGFQQVIEGIPGIGAQMAPALQELAREHNVRICGKDFKTGQTLLKTMLALYF